MVGLVVDFSAACKKSQLITVWEHRGNNSDFSLDMEHFVPFTGLVVFIQKDNLLSLDVHSMSSEDIQNQKIRIRILLQPLRQFSEGCIAFFEACVM